MKTEYLFIPVLVILIFMGYLQFKQMQLIEDRLTTSDTTKTIDTTIIKEQNTLSSTIREMQTNTVIVDSTKYVNLDSLFQEALVYWKDSLLTVPKEYVASKDTVIGDSLVTAKLSINSPIPIHPKTYIKAKFDYQIPVVKETITVTKTVTPLVTYGLQVGGGYGAINQKFETYIGLGLQLNFGRLL